MEILTNGLLNTSDAAVYLGLKETKSTLSKWRMAGTGPAYIKIGKRKIAYRKEDLDNYLIQCRKNTSESVEEEK
jgi:predicted DNA-binding transcriptional regulator AlpA